MRSIGLLKLAVLAVPAVLVTTTGRAQGSSPAPSAAEVRALWSRMDALTDSMRDYGPSESFAAYFPREGTWVWRQTVHGAPGGDRVAFWRFPASRTVEALSNSGPLCDSFFRGGGEVGTGEMTIAGRLSLASARWRRFGTRFVPPGVPVSSPTYVEWRRERGTWVIAEFGDEDTWFAPRPVGPRTQVRRSPSPGPLLTLPLPEGDRYAGMAAWFKSDGLIWLGGLPRVKYGLPRQLGPGDVTRIGWVEGVAVYTEPQAAEPPEVIYVVVDDQGAFQPYYPATNYFCH